LLLPSELKNKSVATVGGEIREWRKEEKLEGINELTLGYSSNIISCYFATLAF
jgi:hypothetical protein